MGLVRRYFPKEPGLHMQSYRRYNTLNELPPECQKDTDYSHACMPKLSISDVGDDNQTYKHNAVAGTLCAPSILHGSSHWGLFAVGLLWEATFASSAAWAPAQKSALSHDVKSAAARS